ncbi:MAG: TonB-dependent receptor, partial [Gemmatimonas sp.]|nr:TonB-dependent receptor [Gemmatimonas sp.]
TFGVNIEGYESENVFFPGKQSAYVYNTLSDFYADARGYVNACGTGVPTTACSTYAASPAGIGPRRFQVRYTNIPGQEKPIQPLEVNFMGAYVQDEWRVGRGLTVTGGVRVDVVSFGNTAEENAQVNGYTFRDENGAAVQYNTAKLPDATPLVSPRVGFNYDLRGNGQTIVRGGTGIFTGRPAYVWISNQIGNNGILTGFIQDDGAGGSELTNRPFNPNTETYKPTTVTGAPAASYELALTDKNFKFPQVWRSNLAVDHRFESGWLVTTEFLWGRDMNGVYYINANLPANDAAFAGPDQRPRWVSDKCPTVSGTQTNRINCNITSAIVLKNQNVGETYNASVSLERSFRNGFYTKGALAYGTATNTVDAGSIAFGSWNNNQHPGDPNNPGVGNAAGFQGRRAFLVSSYTRDWFGWGNTTVSAFLENFTFGTSSYVFGGDLNGDGGTSNDLIYVPRDQSEMNFAPITGATPFTAAQQAAAWDAYINQDPHLRTRRGQYALRGGLVLPNVTRMDLSVAQDLSKMFAGKKNSLQVRLDILNFTNMINSDWGLSQSVVNNSPLVPRAFQTTGTVGGVPCTTAAPCNGPADASGRAIYTMRVVNGQLLNRTFQKNAGTGDVWRMQLGLRYTFN